MKTEKEQYRPSIRTCYGVALLALPVTESYQDMEDGWKESVVSIADGFTLS